MCLKGKKRKEKNAWVGLKPVYVCEGKKSKGGKNIDLEQGLSPCMCLKGKKGKKNVAWIGLKPVYSVLA